MGTSEEEIIERIKRWARQRSAASVRVGIGDDCAVLTPPAAGRELLVTTDQVIENTHFRRDLHPPRALGRKTLARGLSDIAAMGGVPLWALLSLSAPRETTGSWLEQYLEGMFSSVTAFDCPDLALVGGDTARGTKFCAHLTVIGSAPKGAALVRSGARPGNLIYVSGRLGGSALGLARLLSGEADSSDDAVRRHLEPTPRLALGRFLGESGRASAAIDLSDGLSTDLDRLLKASGAGALIKADAVPRFPGASIEEALHGGEEYELLFTAPADAALPSEQGGVRLTRIGEIVEGEGAQIRRNGKTAPLAPRGFEHF